MVRPILDVCCCWGYLFAIPELLWFGEEGNPFNISEGSAPQFWVRELPQPQNRTAYFVRGWCYLEFCIAHDYGRIANLSDAEVQQLANQAPADPEAFEKAFEHKQFTEGGDRNLVKQMFTRLYGAGRVEEFLRRAENFDIAGLER